MKIFITGASGFVGKHLLEYLSYKSNIQLFSLFRKKKYINLKNFNFTPVFGDLFSLDNLDITDDIDVLIHIAGITKSLYPQQYYKINTQGTANIIKFAKKLKVKQIIFISSLAAFGPASKGVPINEESKPSPVSNYGFSKLIAERLLINTNIPYTVIRPPAVFGPEDRDIYAYFKMVKNGFSLTSGDKNKLYSMIYVKDLAAFIAFVILNEKAFNNSFFIGNNKYYTISNIIESIENALNVKSFKINLPENFTNFIFYPAQIFYAFSKSSPLLNLDKLKELKGANWICSAEKAEKIMGFKPKYGFDEAIKETAKWYLKNNWL